ncbi:MAG: hypothetical protein IJ316_02850 [Clostridia bacterium]|nr:hypothetical protein [Clostridia bacterium]
MKTWHKIAIAIIVIVGVVVCVKSCVDRKSPDLTIAYIGKDFVNRESYDKNVTKLYNLCSDITGDGDISIDIMEISYSDELSHSDKSNSNQKMTNAVGNGAARLYFIEEEYVTKNLDVDVFCDLTELYDGKRSVIKNSSGQIVAISVKGSKKVAELGIEPKENLYIAIRKITEMDNFWNNSVQEQNTSATNIAEYILAN